MRVYSFSDSSSSSSNMEASFGSDSSSADSSFDSLGRLGEQPSVLVVGASSETGIETIQQLRSHYSQPLVHAFHQESHSLPRSIQGLCVTVYDGDVFHACDIEEALHLSGANWIVLAGDIPEERTLAAWRPDIRTVAARSTALVLGRPEFQHVRVLAVSRIGAQPSRLRVGVKARLGNLKFRRILADHAGQEKELESIRDRTIVLRTMALVNGASSRSVVELVDNDTAPTHSMKRADLTACIVDEICGKSHPSLGRVVHLTSARD